jgi:nitrogen fixation protein NifU and related proteins
VSNDQADMHQEVIIDHGRRPHNFPKLKNATRIADGANPLCCNQLTVHLELTDDRIINDIASRVLEGPSRRPASLMSTVLTGKSEEEAFALFGDVHAMLTVESDGDVNLARLGSLAALLPMSEFPIWVKCATLVHTQLEAPSTTTPRGPGSSRG